MWAFQAPSHSIPPDPISAVTPIHMHATRLRFRLGEPRPVPMSRAFAWYEQAMRLFKISPVAWCVLGAATLVSDLMLQLVPWIGIAASKVIVPVIECGMLLGAAAVDHG